MYSNELQARLSAIPQPSSKLLLKHPRLQDPANKKVIPTSHRVKSQENISILKSDIKAQNPNIKNQNQPNPNPQKKPFIEPGTPCENFEETLSTTSVVENGITTYFIAKALRGPLLRLASEECKKKQPAKKPNKKIP